MNVNTKALLCLIILLIARTTMAATPAISVAMPTEAFSGEQFCFEVDYTITDGPGYSPYIQLTLPPDITFNSAAFLGAGTTNTNIGFFPASPDNTLEDPLTGNVITGSEGNAFHTIQLPLGSVVANGPQLTTKICGTIASSAIIGVPLALSTTPVFQLGDTPTGANGPIVGSTITTTVTPVLSTLTLSASAAEAERAPGLSFPVTYNEAINVANGKTVHNIDSTATLSNNMQYIGTTNVTGGTNCIVAQEPLLAALGGEVNVTCDSVTGTTSTSDVVIGLNAYIIDVLDETSCSTLALTHDALLDSEYPASTSLPQSTQSTTITAKHIAVQQGVSSSGVSPGDTVTFTNRIQVTEFGNADSLVISDKLADGFTFLSDATFLVNGSPVAVTSTQADLADGITQIDYDVTTVTGILAAGTEIVLSYTATIDQTYQYTTLPVMAADQLANVSTVTYSLVEGASNCTDHSGATVRVRPVTASKTVLNPQTEYSPGDVVTYRLSLDVPSGDTQSIIFEDFLPLPAFDVSSINTVYGNDVTRAAIDTLGSNPTSISVDSATNSLKIVWPDINTTELQTLAVDINVAVTDAPFADNLLLTNLLQITTKNSIATTTTNVEPVQINVRAPELVMTQGVSASTNATADGTIFPSPSILPVDGDIANSDAGDTVTYVITIENIGGAPASDVTITNVLPSGLVNASITSVTDGSGTPLGYTGDLFSTSMNLTPLLAANDGTVGEPYTADSVIITYAADIDSLSVPREVITNSASVTWASSDGATPYPAVSDSSDITIADPTIVTTVDSVSPEGGSGLTVTGDTVTYRTTVSLPEGTTPDLVVQVSLPAGLGYVAGTTTVDTAGFVGTVDPAPTVNLSGSIATGQLVLVNFDSPANTVVTNNNTSTDNSFSFIIKALVKDDPANSATSSLQSKTLISSLTYTGISGASINDSASTDFAEHDLLLTTSLNPATGLKEGDTVTVTHTVTNNGTAPAYDVVVTDTVNAGSQTLFDLSSVAASTTPANVIYDYSNATVTYTMSSGEIAVGGTITMSYTANVIDGVISGSDYQVTASTSGDSQDGVVSEERSSNDTDTTPAAVDAMTATSLTLVSSSEDWTSDVGGVGAAIGEVLSYQFTVDVPEAVTNTTGTSPIVEIALPAGYVYQTGSATVQANSGVSIYGSNYAGGVTPFPTTSTLVVPTVNGQILEFDWGNITNNDSDAGTEQLVINIDVLVANTSNNNRSNSKTIQGIVNYDNVAENPQTSTTSATSTIVEPNLTATLSGTPGTVNGGDLVTYTSVIRNRNNSNSARAWDWVIEETLSARLQTPSLTSITLSRGTADISDCGGFVGNILTVDSSACPTATNRYLDPGDTITIVYQAAIEQSVGFEEEVQNTNISRVTSLPGTNGTTSSSPGIAGDSDGERIGDGAGENDLLVNETVTVIADKPSVTVLASKDILQIGETALLSTSLSVPIGTTGNFVYTLDLPTGLSYDGSPVTIGLPVSDFSSSLMPSTAPGAGIDPVVFDFGTISNSSVVAQSLTISVPVVVDNILANQNSISLTSTGTLNYTGASSPLPSGTEVITVIEANIDLSKTITAGLTGSDAGDTVSYQVVVTNSAAQATAYRVNLVDILPEHLLGAPDGSGSGITFQNITVDNDGGQVIANGGGPLVTGDAVISATTNVSDTLGWPLFDLPASTSLTITYDAVIHQDAVSGSSLSSTITAAYNSLSAGSGRDNTDSFDDDNGDLDNYGEQSTAALIVDAATAVQVALNSVHAQNEFTIGDKLTLDVRVDVVEGITGNVVVTSVLPDGLKYIGPARIVAAGNISYDGSSVIVEAPSDTLTLSMGTLTNAPDGNAANDSLIVELDVEVENIVSNINGAVVTTTVSMASDVGSVGPDTEAVTIVEPNLELTLVPDSINASLGDIMAYTVTVSHSGSSASDAYEVSLNAIMPAGLSYVSGSHSGQGSADETDPNDVQFTLGSITQIEGSKSFTFKAVVDSSVLSGSLLSVTTNAGAYSSLPGSPVSERDYAFSGSADVTADNPSFLDASQAVTLLNDVNGNGEADPGDILAYTAILTNTGVTASNVHYAESIPVNTTYVADSLITTVGTVNQSSNPDLQVSIGTLNNSDVVTISYQVSINAGVSAGTEIFSQGSVDSSVTVPELTDSDNDDSNGDQPTHIVVAGASSRLDELYLQQTAALVTDLDASGDVTEGDVIGIRYFVKNLGSNTLDNVDISEVVPDGLTIIPASGVVSGGGNSISLSGVNVAVTIPALGAGLQVNGYYEVTVDSPLFDGDATPSSEVFTLQALAQSDQSSPVDSDSNGNPLDGNQPVSLTAVNGVSGTPDLLLNLRWSLIVDRDNDGAVDPGDTVRYVYTLVNQGAATAEDLVLGNLIPNDTELVSGTGNTSQGITVSEEPLVANIGDVAPGGVVTGGFDAVINNGVADGTVIASQGTVTGSNFADVDSDDNGDRRDGQNPTLFTVSQNAVSPSNVSIAVIDSSNIETVGAQFLRGETLQLEAFISLPAGSTTDLQWNITLPDDIEYQAGSAQIARTFDTGMTISRNPGAVNSNASGVFSAMSDADDVLVSGNALRFNIGSVINSDSDLNVEALRVRFTVNTANKVATGLTEPVDVLSVINYLDSHRLLQSTMQQLATLTLLWQSPAGNQLPIANDDSVAVDEDGSVIVDVIDNDTDGDGCCLRVQSLTQGANGSVLMVDDVITYQPSADFNGIDSFSYTLSDGHGGMDTATVTVTVNSVNDAPQTQGEVARTNIDIPVTIDVLTNSTDDGNALQLVSASVPFGEVAIVNGELVYTPPEGFSGTVFIEYMIEDGQGGFATGVVQVIVAPDSLSPTINVPDDIVTDSSALYTKVDLGTAEAHDRFGNPLPVALSDGITFFEPGINRAIWVTTDSEGRTSSDVQTVSVRPLVSFAKDQTALTNQTLEVGVYLNGLAPTYPLDVAFSVTGDDGINQDFLYNSSIVIQQGMVGYIALDPLQGELPDAYSKFILTLDETNNRSSQYRHTITIEDGNIVPELTVSGLQNQQSRLTFAKGEGDAVLLASVFDQNAMDNHVYQWTILRGTAIDTDLTPDTFTLEPSSMDTGLYLFDVLATDDGLPPLSHRTQVYVAIVESLKPLSLTDDSDADLIPDYQEGHGDDDGDGVANYLDNRIECNVLPEEIVSLDAFQVEGDPGVCLRRGLFTIAGDTGGAMLTDQDIARDPNITPDTEATNVGGIFDFIATGLPVAGQTYNIIMPQRRPVPANAVYRKYREVGGWRTFTENINNRLASAHGEFGFCPPPESSLWKPGLNEGDWCVQVSIEDGGVNDDDAIANGAIIDPGGVAVLGIGNQLPIAANDLVQMTTNTATTIAVLSNDSDPDGDALSVLSASASFGVVVIESDGSLTYTPNTNFVGNDTIVYGIGDGNGGTDVAEVQMTISVPIVDSSETIGKLKTKGGGGSIDVASFVILMMLILFNVGRTMIAKIKLRQLISASLILVSTAHLQAADSENQSTDSSVFVDAYYDLYLTGAIGFATTDVSKSDMNDRFADKGFDASTDSVDGDRFGWNVGIGYDITERWSVELAYYDLGDVDVVFQATPVVESVADIYPESGHGWAIAGKYRHPITEKIDLTGKLGLFSWDADYDTEFTSTGARVGDDDDSGNDLFYGVGADYHYNDKWTLTAQLQRFEFDRDATHFLSVGFEYRWSKARTSVLESERPMTLAEQPAVETTSQPTALAAAPLVVAAPLDSDNDGIVDQADRCPDTAEGTMVNEVGCTVLEVQNLRFELDVKFATASDEIDPTHTGSLNEMTELMKQHPEVIVVIEGHTDSRGAASYNQNLSDKRAKSVVRYLVEEGSIDKSRLSAVGYGESKPVASNATAEGRKENRRVIAVVNIQKTADPLK